MRTNASPSLVGSYGFLPCSISLGGHLEAEYEKERKDYHLRIFEFRNYVSFETIYLRGIANDEF